MKQAYDKDGNAYMFDPKSDSGKLRHSLGLYGYRVPYAWEMFVDPRKGGVTRLKSWVSTDVFQSSVEQQQQLEQELKKRFGQRYIRGWFRKNPVWSRGGCSLNILLGPKA